MSRIESTRYMDTVASFDRHVTSAVKHLTYLEQFFAEAMMETNNLEIANARLVENGRLDLAVHNPVKLPHLEQPAEIFSKCSNYVPHFGIFTSYGEDGPVTATEEDLNKLRGLPLIQDHEEYRRLKESGEYPGLGLNHTQKASFLRMLVLYPSFTKDLVLGIGTTISEPHGPHYARFEPELFAAHHLMSRLVDSSDYGVTDKDGKLRTAYLDN